MKKITLIRHGKTVGNLEKRYIGITDEQLCKEGEEEILAKEYPKADIVFSSPLFRAVETAALIYPGQEIYTIDELKETNFGEFEGKSYKELSDNPKYSEWIASGGDMPFPGGESKDEANRRTMEGFKKLLERIGDNENISVVAHGGTIMAILSELFGGDYYSYHVENGEGYTFEISSDGIYSGLSARSFNR
ncbi:MAG: histidine phosphatase family protein [Pseudobutyrivibrio sp.]|nr:histidine phosphatase family protein [Pseudobutyrivibrio sp.]